MNFDQVTTTAETFDPQGQVPRSTQTVEEQSSRNDASTDRTVSVTNNLPTSQPTGGSSSGARENNNRNEETVNFEISRTVRNEVQRPGGIRRLSIAVQVDGVQSPQQDGTSAFTPRTAEELAELEALAKSAAGFDEARGDVFQIASRRFLVAEQLPDPEPGILERLGVDGHRLSELGILALLTLAVVFFGVRPLLNRLLPPPVSDAAALASGSADERLLLANMSGAELNRPSLEGQAGSTALLADGTGEGGVGPAQNLLLKEATQIVEERPQDAIKVIRAWLGE
jgi:flagellar M-ring protein FliF